jgi:hypothetical protein
MNGREIFDALRVAQDRDILPTSLSSSELREYSAGLRARSVFVSRGSNAIFAGKLKSVIEELVSGNIGEADARLALLETLKALGYTPEGGFPTESGQVPPAVRGSLQDLTSFRRLNLIVRTQVDLMAGAGLQFRGTTPERLAAFPCWELIRVLPVRMPRDWAKRWEEVGGILYDGRIIAPKGDLLWGELGSNFDDSLDVDYPPFAFNSGMGWDEVDSEEADALGVTASDGTPWREFINSIERPRTLSGTLPMPTPKLNLADVPTEIVEEFQKQTSAIATGDEYDFDAVLARALAKGDALFAERSKKP